jgi:hypothetical protein
MPKVILLVNVDLKPGHRDEYLAATGQLRSHFQEVNGVEYAIFENQGKESDSFTETFTFGSTADYEAFDDRDDEEANGLFAKIISMAKHSPKYTTLFEVE